MGMKSKLRATALTMACVASTLPLWSPTLARADTATPLSNSLTGQQPPSEAPDETPAANSNLIALPNPSGTQIKYRYAFSPTETVTLLTDTSGTQFQQMSKTSTEHPGFTETKMTYDVSETIAGKTRKAGTLLLTQDTFSNGDFYYMTSFTSAISVAKPIHFHFYIDAQDSTMTSLTERHTVYPNGYALDDRDSKWDGPSAVSSKLPNDTVYLANSAYNLYMSRSDVYRMGGNHTWIELPNKVQPTRVIQNKHQTEFSFSFPQIQGDTVEQYAFVSNHHLLNWKSAFQVRTLAAEDFNNNQKLTSVGPLSLMYSTYSPYTRTSYWAMPANYTTISMVGDGPFNRLFHDLGQVQLYDVLQEQTKDGVWMSTPSSNMVTRESGGQIGANFFDTRFNSDLASFMVKTYEEGLNDPHVLQAATNYFHFLENYTTTHVVKTQNGFLASDYANLNKPHALTPTALNHDLAQMEFLYQYYLLTEDTAAKVLADEYKAGIDDTGVAWVKPSNDLYYRRRPGGTYTGTDYPTITLNDLIICQHLFQQVDGTTDPIFQQLIDAKLKYLNNSKLKIHATPTWKWWSPTSFAIYEE